MSLKPQAPNFTICLFRLHIRLVIICNRKKQVVKLGACGFNDGHRRRFIFMGNNLTSLAESIEPMVSTIITFFQKSYDN
jgi:hypothetical protein